MRKGLLIIYSGPSGVGKGTVREQFFKMEELNLAYSISMTTRTIRPGERDGIDYFFVTQERFEEAIKNDELLEHATYVSNSYGTPAAYVEKLRNEGKNVLLEIEVNGALQVMEKCKDALSIFIVPPSLEVLEQRLRDRKTDTEEAIKNRIETAKKELQTKDKYQYIVVNDTVESAAKEIAAIIKSHIK